jgi:hypothetical protein
MSQNRQLVVLGDGDARHAVNTATNETLEWITCLSFFFVVKDYIKKGDLTDELEVEGVGDGVLADVACSNYFIF